MSLVAPFWLLAGAAALLVVLMHAMRRDRVHIPSLILWGKLAPAEQKQISIRPPRWSFPLLLQLLAVLCLTLALAQPMLGASPDRILHDIYVLDASGSMRATDVAPSRFDAALADLIRQLPGDRDGSRVSVAVAGGEPQLLFARQPDGNALIEAVRSLSAGDGVADWTDLSRKLAGIVRTDEDTRIVIWTNGQDNPAATMQRALPGVQIETRLVGDPQSANASITGSISPVANVPGRWRLQAHIALHATAAPAEVVLRFRPVDDSGVAVLDSVTPQLAEDGQSAFVDQEITLPSDGTLLLSLPPDLHPADNTFGLLVRTAPARIRVVYIGPGNRPLQLALLARGDVDLFGATTLPADADRYDLVVADGVVLPRKPATNTLWLGSARPEAEAEPIAVTAIPTGWNSGHPLSDNVRWSAINNAAGFAGPVLPGAAVLLAAAEGPLVAARTSATGREVRLGLDLDASGWASSPDFPIFVSNLLDWIAAGPLEVCTVGKRCIIPARLVGQGVVDENGTDIVRPASPGSDWLLDEANGFVPQRAGIYSIGGNDGQAIRIVNASPETSQASPPSPASETAAPARPIQVASWLLLGTAALLALEAVLAGRGRDGFLRLRDMARGIPDAGRRRWALGLRGLALLLVVAALLAVPLLLPRQGDDTVLIMAPQAGGDPRRTELTAAIEDPACAGLPAPSHGLVGLSAIPYVVSDLSCGGQASAIAPDSAGAADLAGAVELATAMIRPGATGHVVIADDGSQPGEGLGSVLANLRDRGVGVDVLPLIDRPAGDTVIAAVESPARPVEGDRLPIRITVDSASGGTIRLGITSDGVVVDEIEVAVAPGSNVVDASLPEVAAGTHVIGASLIGADDPVPQNDRAEMMLDVAARPVVAIVAPQVEWGRVFANALSLQGIDSRVLLPDDAPTDLSGWLRYSAVVLMNVPASALDSWQQEQLEHYVRIDGRGLLILGGENSFGPGGYYETPLEALSPLSARVPKDMPAAAMGFVLDRSGSMKAGAEGVTLLDLAKSATLSAVELLNEKSQVSIVVFDTQPTVLVPMQDRRDVAEIEDALRNVGPGGGTAIAPGLSEMLDEMGKSRNRVRHIVVMSDGQSQGGDPFALVRSARSQDITISAVAIGRAADVGMLRALARDGGGAFHFTEDFRTLASILSQEAIMLSGKSMESGFWPVAWVDRDVPFLNGLPDPMPDIEAYVMTTTKPEARLHLATVDEDGDIVPILASWQYGNGAVLALATHGAGPGSARWMTLPEYPMLWSQVIRSFLPTLAGPGMTVTIERNGEQGTVVAEILDAYGEPVAALAPVAAIARDGRPAGDPLALQMAAPGRYVARFDAGAPGLYNAAVTADGYAASAAMSVAYAAQFDFTRAQPERLEAFAAATGGQLLTGTEPLAASSLVWQFDPVRRPWILLALVVLLADLAVRYVPGRFGFPVNLLRRPAMAGAVVRGLPSA